jgi:hypothetical protein
MRRKLMSHSKPDHEDAQLIMRLYELRREDEMRKARTWFAADFLPLSVDDVTAVWFDRKNPHNAHFRMFTSYWDMAASFVAHGVLNGDLFLESGAEMVACWAKLEEFIPELRQKSGMSDYLSNIEKVIEAHPFAQERLAWMRSWIKDMREKKRTQAERQ